MVLKVGQRVAHAADEATPIGEISYGPFKVQAGSSTNWYLVRRPDGTDARFTQRDLVPVARFQVGEYFRTASGVRAKVSAGPFRSETGYSFYVASVADGSYDFTALDNLMKDDTDLGNTFWYGGEPYSMDRVYVDCGGDDWKYADRVDEESGYPLLTMIGDKGTTMALDHLIEVYGPLTEKS